MAMSQDEMMKVTMLTAGLNSPPLIRKKTHAFAARENPNAKLMYSSSEGFFCATVVMTVVPVLVLEEIFATLRDSFTSVTHSFIPDGRLVL